MQNSTAGSKRSFLLSKGLTDDEIDEAFRRTQSGAPAPASQVTPAATDAVSDVPAQSSVKAPPYSWSQTILGTAVLACAAYGFGSMAYPHVIKAWRWLTKASASESPSDTQESKLIELLTKHVQQQEETNQEIKTVAEAVKEIQVPVFTADAAGNYCVAVDGMRCMTPIVSYRLICNKSLIVVQASNSRHGSAEQSQSTAQINALRDEVSKLATAMKSSVALSTEVSVWIGWILQCLSLTL